MTSYKADEQRKKLTIRKSEGFYNPFTDRKYQKDKHIHRVLQKLGVVDENGCVIKNFDEIRPLRSEYERLRNNHGSKGKLAIPKEDEAINPLTNRIYKKDSKTHVDLLVRNIVDEEGKIITNNLEEEKNLLTFSQKVNKIQELMDDIFSCGDQEDVIYNFNYLTLKLKISYETRRFEQMNLK